MKCIRVAKPNTRLPQQQLYRIQYNLIVNIVINIIAKEKDSSKEPSGDGC
jgi:hypothetical protein